MSENQGKHIFNEYYQILTRWYQAILKFYPYYCNTLDHCLSRGREMGDEQQGEWKFCLPGSIKNARRCGKLSQQRHAIINLRQVPGILINTFYCRRQIFHKKKKATFLIAVLLRIPDLNHSVQLNLTSQVEQW